MSFEAVVHVDYEDKECLDDVKFVYGDEIPSCSSVKNWYNECDRRKSVVWSGIQKCREGREDVNEDVRSGRPNQSRNEENVEVGRAYAM